jgi:hypothetical protein
MAEPIAFDIALRGSVWVLTRDGQEVHAFSHVDRATHEAVRLARELEESGQPARVQVHAAEGKVIEVRLDPEPDRSDGPEGGDRSLV